MKLAQIGIYHDPSSVFDGKIKAHCIRCKRTKGAVKMLKPYESRSFKEKGIKLNHFKYRCECGGEFETTREA